jgi:hypothetical protein
MTTIEAALGVRADYGRSQLSRTATGGLSATRRVAARGAALLGRQALEARQAMAPEGPDGENSLFR